MFYIFRKLHESASFLTTVTVVSLSAMVMFSQGAYADNAATGDASINIAVPVQISQEKALNFGQVIRSNNDAGSVKVDRNGNRTGTNVVLENNATVSAGQFAIFGEKNHAVTVAIDESATLTNEEGVTLVMSTNGDSASQTLNGNGQATYKVGGEIGINANQPSGNYRGTYNVTVSY